MSSIPTPPGRYSESKWKTGSDAFATVALESPLAFAYDTGVILRRAGNAGRCRPPGRKGECVHVVSAVRSLCVLLCAAAFGLAGAMPSSAASAPRDPVLILHSYHRGEWTDRIGDGIQSVLGSRPRTDVHIEYMDTKKLRTPEYLDQLARIYRMKYAAVPFKVIIVSDDDALNFATRHQRDVFAGAPIVFCGVNAFDEAMLRTNPDVTGVLEEGDFEQTLTVAFQMRPAAQRLLVIHDATSTSDVNLANLHQVLAARFSGIQMVDLGRLTLDELHQRMASADPRDAAFFVAFWTDAAGEVISPDQLAPVFRSSAVPIFGRSEWMIGKGEAGGKCVSGFKQGSAAGALAQQVLDGTPAGRLPVVRDDMNVFMFDQAELRRHRISASQVPAGSVVANAPERFYRVSKPMLVLLLALVAALVAFLVSAIVFTRRRHHSERMLRLTRFVVEHSSDGVLWLGADGCVREVNATACRQFARSREELIGVGIGTLAPAWTAAVWSAHWAALHASGALREETPFLGRGRSPFPAEVLLEFARFEGLEYACAFVRNITERRRLEERLRQSQRMESVGQLAGGIAHDFNNMLAGILGAAEVLRLDLAPDDSRRPAVDVIVKSAARAADLTSKLLAFSRKGRLVSEPLDIHAMIESALELFSHSVDRLVRMETALRAARRQVIGDPAQLQNAVLNLCINARDAMPQGGTLRVTTDDITFDAGTTQPVGLRLRAGSYVCIRVEDTGTGIPDDILPRIFDPFFTTKEVGRGTGLGLAAVQGTVIEHGGAVQVKSAVGHGSVFSIYLPSQIPDQIPEPAAPRSEPSDPKTATILVVDDEAVVRTVLEATLSRLGYRVLLAGDGRRGVELYHQHAGRIDLVLLDMIMPEMSGDECFRAIRRMDPAAAVLVVSGYARDKRIDDLEAEGLLGFVRKPFTIDTLQRAVSAALARRDRAGGI